MNPKTRRPTIMEGEIAKIDLAGKGWVTVDTADLLELKDFLWSRFTTGKRIYATTNVYIPTFHSVYMHRMIMKAEPGCQVDHVNGDGLDNRRKNLRFATQQQNNANGKDRIWRNLPRGVYRTANRHKPGFHAQITYDYKAVSLGTFETIEEAAQAYLKKAKEIYGDYARDISKDLIDKI